MRSQDSGETPPGPLRVYGELVFHAIGPGVGFVLLLLAAGSSEVWIFLPVFTLLFLVPGVMLFIRASRGVVRRLPLIGRLEGPGSNAALGAIFIFLYLLILASKFTA